MGCCDGLLAGIFSREDSSTYDWLITLLLATPGVRNVRPVLITNNWSDFTTEAPKCSFAVLFHSKSRGRLNLTNVTDSLYDRELQHLSTVFGREKVIVVIGDMEDSSDEQRDRILREQPDIGIMARDLFLFNQITGDRAPFQGPTKKKLQNAIREMAPPIMKPVTWLFFLGAAFLIVIIILIIVYSYRYGQQDQVSSPPVVGDTSSHVSTTTTAAPSAATRTMSALPSNAAQPAANTNTNKLP